MKFFFKANITLNNPYHIFGPEKYLFSLWSRRSATYKPLMVGSELYYPIDHDHYIDHMITKKN